MIHINFALLTACSCSGKTTISNQLKERYNLPLLAGDEAFGQIFDYFGKPEFKAQIGSIHLWEHLRKDPLFDATFKQYHKYCFENLGTPLTFLAEGWIYSHREWRELVQTAFNSYPHFQFNYKLFILKQPVDLFFARHKSAVKDRDLFDHPLYENNSEFNDQRNLSSDFYWNFYKRTLNLPTKEEMEYQIIENDEEVMNQIVEYCQL